MSPRSASPQDPKEAEKVEAVLCGERSLNGRHRCGLERGHPAVRGHIAFEPHMTVAWGFGYTGRRAPRHDSGGTA